MSDSTETSISGCSRDSSSATTRPSLASRMIDTEREIDSHLSPAIERWRETMREGELGGLTSRKE